VLRSIEPDLTDDAALTEGDGTISLTSKGLVVASLTGLSRVGGLTRDVVISYFLGAGPIADAFFVAFKIPNFFRRLFAEGAFQQAFIPVLADYRENHSNSELSDFIRTVAGNFALILMGLSLVGVLFAQQLIDLFTLRAWVGEARYQAAVDMLRVMFPYLGLISLTAFAGSVLNSYQRFSISAGAPLLLSVCVIVAAIWAAMLNGQVAYAMAWGVLVAGFLQLVVHLPSLRRLRLLHWPRVSFRDEGVRRILKLIVPGVYAASAGQINVLVGTILCAQLTVGTVSWFYYADRLIQLPMALLAIAMQTILLPNLSRLYRKGDTDLFSETVDWGVRVGVLLGLPAAVALYYLSKPILATVFLRGAFEVADVEMTAVALQAFSIGLLPMVLTRVLGPGYFAREDMHTPFVYATIGVGVNIVLSLSLFWWLGLLGIAYATTVAAFVNCYLLMRGLLRGGQYRMGKSMWHFALASVAGCVVMVSCLAWLNFDFEIWVSVTEWRRVAQIGLLVTAGLFVYVVTLLILGVRPRHLIHRV